jgi:hypothetical protein
MLGPADQINSFVEPPARSAYETMIWLTSRCSWHIGRRRPSIGDPRSARIRDCGRMSCLRKYDTHAFRSDSLVFFELGPRSEVPHTHGYSVEVRRSHRKCIPAKNGCLVEWYHLPVDNIGFPPASQDVAAKLPVHKRNQLETDRTFAFILPALGSM